MQTFDLSPSCLVVGDLAQDVGFPCSRLSLCCLGFFLLFWFYLGCGFGKPSRFQVLNSLEDESRLEDNLDGISSDDDLEEVGIDPQQKSSKLQHNAVNSMSNALNSSSSAAGPHVFKALLNPDGDSDVPNKELDAVTAFIHRQIVGKT